MKKLLFTLLCTSSLASAASLSLILDPSGSDSDDSALPVVAREEHVFSCNIAAIKSIFDRGAESSLQTFFRPLKYDKVVYFKSFDGNDLTVPLGKGVPVLTQDQVVGREKFLVVVKQAGRHGTSIWFLTHQEKGGMFFRDFLPLIDPTIQKMKLEHMCILCASITHDVIIDEHAPAQLFAGFVCFVGKQLYIVDDNSDYEVYLHDLEDDGMHDPEQISIQIDNAGDTDALSRVQYRVHDQLAQRRAHHRGFTPLNPFDLCPDCFLL